MTFYNVTEYVRDHPGGPDLLIDVAGTDATEAYEDVGHSDDASAVLKTFLIGTLKGAQEFKRPTAVRLIQQSPSKPESAKQSTFSTTTVALVTSSLGGAALSLYLKAVPSILDVHGSVARFYQLSSHWIPEVRLLDRGIPRGGFFNGFVTASVICAAIGGIVGIQLSKFTQINFGFERYAPHMKSRKIPKSNPHLAKGFLEPKQYKTLPLVRKDTLAPNVYRFVFQLPRPHDVIGLPIGQHVAIQATVNGASVSRSYTPTSNNLDRGVLELVIKCYPDGVLTGQYLANLQVGDQVQFRGPKGAMKYNKGLCKKIGMIAGGTGITPMYQLIRAICEDDRDTTEVSLIYANRSEEDILLRSELETFARCYPRNLKIWYMLDNPPKKWAYGKGYVTADIMREKLPSPSPDTKIMLCGPPGMVNASKKALVSLGFQAPGAVSKMTDQIFSF
ncbi:hypothetical protein MPDQ_004879 [Monascus purpureus]|uniref:Cytochrome-b5 reductase n=1 Tax=Monascus purpureus TaxID=5098 RepID=A0A507R1H3_MONPU|nr:hypothetical protein MPDQ_004879 [Monascus purpureus]